MGFGSAFTSAWNKASNAVQQKVAQVATTAKQVVNQAAAKTQEVAQQAKAAVQFVVSQTAKAAAGAQQAVKKAAATVQPQIAKAVEKATQNVINTAQAAKQTINTAQNAGKQAASSTARQVKNAFNKIKKDFSPVKAVKKSIQTCPLLKPLRPAVQILESKASPLSKGASLLSFGIDKGKDLPDIIKVLKAGYKAAKYGPDTVTTAMSKRLLRNVTLKSIGLGIALDGLVGGFDSFARNVDKKDISNANKAGRVGFGVAKGLTKGVITTGGGAATGAIIGGLIGSIIPGPGTLAGAAVGAKLGVVFLSPLFDKGAEKFTDKVFNDKREEKAGEFADKAAKKISSAAKGAWVGAINLFRPPKFAY